MIFRMLLKGMAAIACVLAAGCSPGTQRSDNCLFMVGGDTVSVAIVNRLVPDSVPRPQKLLRAARELAFVKESKKAHPDIAEDRRVKQAGGDLALQLSRLSSDSWSAEAGVNLYIAAKLLAGRALATNSLPMACGFSDSLVLALVTIRDSSLLAELRKKKTAAVNAPVKQGDQAFLEALFAFQFDLPPPSARILGEFVATAEKEPATSTAVNPDIKGLLFDSTRQQAKTQRPARAAHGAVVADNSKEALRFRSRVSIKDSIGKHIPELEALYKKHLKMHESMEGTIWVTFLINPDGTVAHAQVKTSSITEKGFLIPFRDYVMQKIRFQRIPDKVGAMSVEFPFEFTPQR
jgi:hypothetical protein